MYIRKLAQAFDPAFVKKDQLYKSVQRLATPPVVDGVSSDIATRSLQERRFGDRRQRKQNVLLDLRSPHARRRSTGRRERDSSSDDTAHHGVRGIDVYV